ncbi:hypothetical protein [Pseudoalteromonas translucida]|uniref:hypothetical protein n=1 Tax=Pseudoalteromonas translucida TaxID=166935 RepID=UPI00072E9816|nr:hypothetical protein [Pseudoalteromonas translucida]
MKMHHYINGLLNQHRYLLQTSIFSIERNVNSESGLMLSGDTTSPEILMRSVRLHFAPSAFENESMSRKLLYVLEIRNSLVNL